MGPPVGRGAGIVLVLLLPHVVQCSAVCSSVCLSAACCSCTVSSCLLAGTPSPACTRVYVHHLAVVDDFEFYERQQVTWQHRTQPCS